MSTSFEDIFGRETDMRRGLWGGAQVPRQQMDFNFSETGMGGAFSNPLVAMMVQPLINTFFGHGGVMPAQFAPQQGLYDQWRAKQYWMSRQAAMATASQADRETYVQMIRGMAQMRGTPWGLEQQRSANVMASDLAFMAPLLAQAMPETFDELHGLRGSATVMASFLHRGGLLGVDPTTGRTGLSGASAGVLAAEMHRRFFGVDADLAGWRGLSAGRAGALYDELQTRGLMGMSVGAMTPAEQTAALQGSLTSRQDALRLLQAQEPDKFRRIAAVVPGAANLTGDEQIRRLSDVQGIGETAIREVMGNQPQADTLLRQFDANQIGNRLKNMAGAVTAMREIFGDMGRPNAPMRQIMEGLEALTQGGLATMNPAELERSVRMTQVIARTSGIGMAGLVGLTTQGVAMAQQAGLDPRFGRIAAEGAAEFGAAFGQVGRGDVAGWGRLSRDKYAMMDEQLRINAAASPMANRIGALMRMVETQEQAGLPVTGPLAAIAAAVRARSDTFINEQGGTESLNIDEGRALRLAELSGFGVETARAFIRGNAANQEQIARFGITNIARRAQRGELQEVVAQSFQEAALGRLSEAGITEPAQSVEIAGIAANAQARAFFAMPPEIRSVNAARNQYMADEIRRSVIAQLEKTMDPAAAAARFEQLFPRNQLSAMVAAGMGRAEQRRAEDPKYQNYQSLAAMADVSNLRVLDQQAILARENAAEVAIGTALGGLSTAGPLARLMEEIRHPSGTFSEAINKALGGVDTDKVRQQLATIDPNSIEAQAGIGAKQRVGVIMEEIMATMRQYDDLRSAKLTPDEKLRRQEELTARISALMPGGGAAAAQLRTELLNLKYIDTNADQATVNDVARRIQSGALPATDEVKVRVAAFAMAGATVDARALQRQKEMILARENITKQEDIDKALRGEMNDKLSEKAIADLKTISTMGGGLIGAAAAADISLGAKVGPKELGYIGEQRALLMEDIAKNMPAAGTPEYAKAVKDRMFHAGNVLDDSRRAIDAILGDTAAMKNLGTGSLALVGGAREKQQLMAQLAAENGLDLTAVIGRNLGDETKLSPDQRAAIAQIRGLETDVDKARADITRKMQRVDKFEPMTPGELADLEKLQARERAPEAEQNQKFITSIMDGDVGDEAGRAAISAALGTGTEAATRRYDLNRRIEAKRELQKMADEQGLSIADLRKEVEGRSAISRFLGFGPISTEEATRASKLFATAGRVAEGDAAANLVSGIKQGDEQRDAAKKEADAKIAAGIGGTMAMSGVVKFVAPDGLDMSGAVGTKTGTGSSPV